ncbi:MAG: phytoene/squalene synthase family protein [Bacteroidetes bacterium]|nr:phytoene/squalene synthase family protein [Bacteroidota bacterium]
MIDLYNKTSFGSSRLITNNYSTSFSLGIRALAKKHQDPIRAIYGFVRVADEIVDTFHQYNKKELLTEFKKDTYLAIERGISTNPILHSFQLVVNEYQIDHQLIEAFLESMEMDLYYTEHPLERYNKYIYGSAEVVGLMCLYVFCDGNKEQFESLKFGAKKLGAAFQKINFLRDLKSDIDERGRLYFPNLKNIQHFDYETKMSIEKDIENDFKDALVAIKQLPISSKFGVYIAYIYFFQLLKNIKKLKPKHVLEKRIRVSTPMKLFLFVESWMRFRLNVM